ncbi:hypothetical protein GCM10025864_29200 [Luteimicrobium album]|uniref:DUF4350 domain-containing protein n=1 Tax=Luteimicrobium album TaxID=1054550 RepID=A0ABQ6I3C2_9MICO|nr:DUF4350 domain-containing protein [Luteimicrobium album]GMA25161.1 hypothetical protein GCM10025864_29200 [Luteimicrobium album]
MTLTDPFPATDTPPHRPGGSGPVRGDGTTTRTRARRRWRAMRWVVGLVLLGAFVTLLLALLRPPSSDTPYAPDAAGPDGGRAVAQILGRHGVHVTYTRSAERAASLARAGTTLAVLPGDTYGDDLSDADLDLLAGTDADLALVGPSDASLAALAPELTWGWGGGYVTTSTASCADPDARAAGTITSAGGGFLPSGPAADRVVTTCFPPDAAEARTGSYAVVDGTRRVAVLDDAVILTNAHLAEAGNAALVLRMLGRHADLVWLVPEADRGADASDGTGASALLPPGSGAVAAWLLVVAVVAIVWRGRRLGPLVAEDLPVVVRASEATRGRGRLYRAGGSRGHAAAGLRAATAARLAARLGVPAGATPEALVDAVVRATGRPAPDVHGLLYGPPPPDDAALLTLARHLDDLESEVRP